MALSLFSQVQPGADAGSLRRRITIRVVGDRDDLARIQSVVYDLGPTFAERMREPDLHAAGAAGIDAGFAIEVAAFGNFTVLAHVRLADQSLEHLTQAVAVLPAAVSVSDVLAPAWAAPPRAASVRQVIAAQVGLGATAALLAAAGLYAWLTGSRTLPLVGSIVLSPSARLLVLAAAAGGLGALLQAAATFADYVQNRNAYSSWVGWYLLRAPTGVALGVITYIALRVLLLPPSASASLSPPGVVLIAFIIGFATPRATTFLRDLFTDGAPGREQHEKGDEAAPLSAVGAEPDSVDRTVDLARQRHEDMLLAQRVVRGETLATPAVYDLAERLKGVNEFSLARRLYGVVRRRNDWQTLKATAVRVGQRHALATYKDMDLSASQRFTRALEILDEVDQLDFAAPSPLKPPPTPRAAQRFPVEQRQESLGLRGAVYKRRWQIEGQHGDLEQSLGCYLAGYELGRQCGGNQLGVETDQGYTGINAAYVLDLLAREGARQSRRARLEPFGARLQAEQARSIRQHLAEALPRLAALPDFSWLNGAWWFHATLAEALFGLGRFDDAIATLRAYNTAVQLPHRDPPLEKVPAWEFESTITQLMSLADLQANLSSLLGAEGSAPGAAADARRVLRDYLGAYAPALDRADQGKVGLALSGGGFRASLFHIGVLAALAERDLLRHVEVLSCVSGGSIVGAHFYLELQRLLSTTPDAVISRDNYLDLVERVLREFLAGVQTDIRGQVFASIWSNIRAFLQPGYTTTRHLGALYERELYGRIEDGRHDQPRYLRDLRFRPKDEPGTFNPKNDNWRRLAKVPMLVLNATTLNTGHNWQFTGTWMGEPPISLDAEIEGNYQLRRMYHDEAPRRKDRWRRWFLRPFAPPDYRHVRLGEAVAASSCVPSLFEPLVFPDLYPGKIVRLVDGGVHDNQGIASLLEQDCTAIIVSDASGQMETQDDPSGGRLGVSLRSFSVSMTRVRQAQFREVAARRRSGLLKTLTFLHLKKDLDADPVDWRDCLDPHEASDDARPADRRGVITGYGIYKSVARLLAGLRTDLDAFTDVEALALMLSGYRQAGAQLDASLPVAHRPDRKPLRQWRFLDVEPLIAPGVEFESVTRQLRIGAQTAMKVWRLSVPLKIVAVPVLVAAAVGLIDLAIVNAQRSLLTVGGLAWLAIVAGASALFPRLVALVRYRRTMKTLGLKALAGALLAVFFKIHVFVFDPLFLRIGRVKPRT